MAKNVAASGSVVIDRPVDQVFAFFADAENDPQWRPAVLSIARTGEVGVGATYAQQVSGPGGRPVSADIEVTAYEPPRRVAFASTSGPVRPRGEYLFEPVENGTRVTFSLSCELTGVKALVMAGMVQTTMDSEVAQLATAKAVLEAS